MQKKQIQYCMIAIISIVIAILLDQWTKFLAVLHLKNQSAIELIKDVFELRYLENKGAAFGIMQNQQVFFLISGIWRISCVRPSAWRVRRCALSSVKRESAPRNNFTAL